MPDKLAQHMDYPSETPEVAQEPWTTTRGGDKPWEAPIDKACDPTTFILAVLSSQALGATSPVTQDPISLIFEAQQFYLSSTDAKTGN